ncbi:MAG: hypothetical protein LQ348_000636 [Seirophora lacunosa]|nr:MAG: hypothetical protein LQ348_000636 [Seirophora lacunosa]
MSRLKIVLALNALRPVAFLSLTTFVLVGLLIDDEEEDEVEEVQENKAGKDGEKDRTFFIPLGFAYELPAKYYKFSDPEWQSFIQLSKNRELCDFLKNQLTGLVGEIGSKPIFQRALGEKNRPRKFWIDIDYPQGPPPEYERKGLEVGEEHISWTTRPVHPLHYAKLQRALWPAPMASSLWASQKTLLSLQISKIRSALGLISDSEALETKKNNPSEGQLQEVAQERGAQKEEHASESDGEMPPGSSSFHKGSVESLTKNGSSDRSRSLPIPDFGGDTLSAMNAFKSTFSQTSSPANTPPERGTVLFSGLVELVGPKGIAVLDVHAVYHPAKQEWRHIALEPRRFQPRGQRPLGGP